MTGRIVAALILVAMAATESGWAARQRVPAGTEIVVRTTETIDVEKAKNGDRFKGVVDDDVIVDGKRVIREGEDVELLFVKGDEDKPDEVGIRLDMIRVEGRNYRVKSRFAEVSTEKKGSKAARNAAIGAGVGAVVGAVAGGKKGALIGAGAGAGGGLLLSAASGGKKVVNKETRLSLTLRQSFDIR